jgi:PadR family transcriptional regulator, regulatory protein PadR
MPSKEYLGDFEQLIALAVVRLRDEAYGMRIRQEIEQTAGREASIGAVYETLSRLERKGFVASRQSGPDEERRGRARRYYKLTGAGAEALNNSMATIRAMRPGLRPVEGTT